MSVFFQEYGAFKKKIKKNKQTTIVVWILIPKTLSRYCIDYLPCMLYLKAPVTLTADDMLFVDLFDKIRF